MPPILSFKEGDVGIRKNLLPRLRQNADEGIVGGVKDQCRYGNTINDVGGGGAFIVIRRPFEAAIISCDFVAELAQRADNP